MNSFRETIQFYLVDSKTPLGKGMHRTVRAAGMLSIRNTKTVSLFKEQGSRKKVQGARFKDINTILN